MNPEDDYDYQDEYDYDFSGGDSSGCNYYGDCDKDDEPDTGEWLEDMVSDDQVIGVNEFGSELSSIYADDIASTAKEYSITTGKHFSYEESEGFETEVSCIGGPICGLVMFSSVSPTSLPSTWDLKIAVCDSLLAHYEKTSMHGYEKMFTRVVYTYKESFQPAD